MKFLNSITRVFVIALLAGLVTGLPLMPRTSAHAAGSYTVAVEGMNGGLWANHGAGFISLGGGIIAAPAVVALPSGTDLYIATGQDHQLYERTDTIGWQLLSTSSIFCLDNPAASITGGTLTVACVGSDNALHDASTSVPAMGLPTVGSFAALGGITGYGPAVASVGGVTTFFVLGQDHQFYARTSSQGWTPLGGSCTGHPAAASDATTTYLACQSGNGGMQYKTNNGSGWSGFTQLGGGFIDGPGIAATSSGPVFVGEGYDTEVWRNTGGGWFGIGGLVQHGLAAVADITPSAGGSAACPGSQSGCTQALLALVNQDRAKYGISPLALNQTQSSGTGTCPGSQGHSVDMAQSGQIWHVNASYPLASFPTGICIPYTTAGENVGMSSSGNEQVDLQTVDTMMMNETPNTPSTCTGAVNHACNILNAAYHQIGIGVYYANNTTWITEDFTN